MGARPSKWSESMAGSSAAVSDAGSTVAGSGVGVTRTRVTAGAGVGEGGSEGGSSAVAASVGGRGVAPARRPLAHGRASSK